MKNKIVIGIISAVLVLYFAGVGYFNFYTLPSTYINGTYEGLKDKSKVLDRDMESFEVTLQGKDDKTAVIPASSINYTVDIPKDARIDQNPFTWPFSLFSKDDHKIDYKPSWNDKKLEELLKNSDLFKNVVNPENAKVAKENDVFNVVPEVIGNKLDLGKLKKSVLNAILHHQNTLKLKDEYIVPTIYADNKDLIESAKLMNELYKVKITFDFDDRKEVITGDQLIGLYDLKGKDFIINQQKARDYVKELAIKYDTFGGTRVFKTTGRGDVTVSGGIYGWQMNVNKTRDELIKALEKKEDVTMVPIYNQEGLSRKTNDIGDTYIEVDIKRQHMWFYKNGKLVTDTAIVTGDPTKNHSTPTGVDKVWSREEGKTLRGLNFGGSSSYAVKVKYWMPINWKDVGIHDKERNAFGGSVYLGDGSHGCINTPQNKVKIIFDNVKINTPVVVYK